MCPECGKKYTGHTGRNVLRGYEEYLHFIINNNNNWKLAYHLLENSQSFGKVNDVMDIMHCCVRGAYMDTIEKSYMYSETIKETN